MNTLKGLWGSIVNLLTNYKQAIFAVFISGALFFPFYFVKNIEVRAIETDLLSEQINILNDVQRTIMFHENEIEMQREFIQFQNSLINQLMNEIRKLRGIPALPERPRPSRSEP